ncbi:pentapeptide repeat-containing protein [Tistlia consotensis]|uniref:pentapeptide repeat-containing protein n=1 Tax=Tistlia consotensis TaxID=1321365 RepID=UPI0013565D1C|nr:pentapeptide repeat-containing protein [Tistlia consotensis]
MAGARKGGEPPVAALPDDHAAFLRTQAGAPDRAAAAERVSAVTSALIASRGQGLQLGEAELSGLDLSGFDLRRATLNRANLHSSDLSDCDLSGAALICPGLERTRFRGANLSGAYVHALAAQVCDFTGADLSKLVDATGSLFHGCYMNGARLSGGQLAGSAFYQCYLEGASLAGADLQGATINECYADKADFSGAKVGQLTLTKVRLRGASFAGASGEGLVIQRPTDADGLVLAGAHLPALRLASVKAAGVKARRLAAPDADIRGGDLANGDFRQADLSRARLVGVGLGGLDLTEAQLQGSSWHDCLGESLVLAGASAENMSAVECRFPAARMAGFAGRCASFRDCDLSSADLEGAYLYRATITGDPPRAMDLTGANLAGAVLVQAYLAADLAGADLSGARLAYARLNQCSLRQADLSGAGLYEASMVKTDCTDARLAGISAPVFADRAPGLVAALEAAGLGDDAQEMIGFLKNLDGLLRGRGRGST